MVVGRKVSSGPEDRWDTSVSCFEIVEATPHIFHQLFLSLIECIGAIEHRKLSVG